MDCELPISIIVGWYSLCLSHWKNT